MTARPSRKMFVHRVDVQRLAETKGRTGGTRMEPETVASAVPCLIDRRAGGRSWAGGGEVEKKKFVILFPDPLELRLGWQLVDSADPTRIFVVNSFDNELNLNRLWVAECEQLVDAQIP